MASPFYSYLYGHVNKKSIKLIDLVIYCGVWDMNNVTSIICGGTVWPTSLLISVLKIRQTLVTICLAPLFTCSNKCLLVKN